MLKYSYTNYGTKHCFQLTQWWAELSVAINKIDFFNEFINVEIDTRDIEVHLAIFFNFCIFFSIIDHSEGSQLLHTSDTMKATILQWPPRLNANCSQVLLFKSPARPLMALIMPCLDMPSSACPRPYSCHPELPPHCLPDCLSFSLGPFCIPCLNANYCVCLPLPARTSTASTLSEPPVWPVNEEETFVERMKLS